MMACCGFFLVTWNVRLTLKVLVKIGSNQDNRLRVGLRSDLKIRLHSEKKEQEYCGSDQVELSALNEAATLLRGFPSWPDSSCTVSAVPLLDVLVKVSNE